MIEQLEKELDENHERETKIAIRGRLITEIKKEIQKDISIEEKKQLEGKLKDLLVEQRKELDNRYREEFLKEKTILGSSVTTLPKGIGISVKRIINSINELKEAKNNKEKIFGTFEVLRSIGQTAATPVLYAGKFLAGHWYLMLIALGIIEISDTDIFKKGMDLIGKNEDNSKLLKVLEDVKQNYLVEKSREFTHKVVDSLEEKIKEKFGDLLNDFKNNILGKFGINTENISQFLEGNNAEISAFLNNHKQSIEELSSFLKENQVTENTGDILIAKALCERYESASLVKTL